MTPGNYIPDQNKFKLSGPPDWWLRGLWDFDPSLVVVPSRQGFFYRLAQRRRINLTVKMAQDLMADQSDTKMLVQYGLVPVTTILATANWSNPFLFEELRRRAPWRLGGAQRVIEQLEAREAQEELDKRVRTDEHITSLSKDAWGLYNKKIGVRSHMYIPKRKESRPVQSPLIKIARS